MPRTFKFTLSIDASEVVAEAKKVARENGANFSGNERYGTFSGRGVEGKYQIQDNFAEVTIDKKPFFVPWGLVERKVREFFE